MCTWDRDHRVQNCLTAFTSIPCHSKVPDTNSAVPSSATQQFFVSWVPGDAFYGARMTLQGMGDGVGGRAIYTYRLITGAGGQAGVVSVPFDVEDSVVVRLQEYAGLLYSVI
jgi:hypothetical protein